MGTRSAWSSARSKADVPGHDRVSEKCIACYPRIEGKTTDGRRADGNALYGGLRGQDPHALQSLMRIGEDGLWAKTAGIPCTTRFRVEQVALPLYPQWGTEPNGYPSRHGIAPAAMRGRCLARAWITPSRVPHAQPPELLAVLQLWRASQQIVFQYDVIRVRSVLKPKFTGSGSTCTATIPCWASTSRARKWRGSGPKSRFTFGRPSA